MSILILKYFVTATLRLPVTSIKPCKTTSWWLDASQLLRYFTDFAVNAKS